ncbi:hypothetical protein JGI3_01077 [Candidatus Kryptobacter tengchongensis]|nr:hypothetical protein JGI3_01077 [Candidatus Kryptobacter tengchongensis]
MAKESQIGLSESDKLKLLRVLEEQGKAKWFVKWKEHMAIPDNLNPFSSSMDDREKVMRYLLLRVLINQQARFEKVKEISIRISKEFTDVILFEPYKISESKLFKVFKEVAGEKGALLYRVGALGGIKPISLFTYRFKAYEGFIKWLNEEDQKFFDIIVQELKKGGTIKLFNFLNTHPILEAGWVGNDPKACRMLVNWMLFLLEEVWKLKVAKMEETLMIVDGHVGKVFCRSGLLEEVLYEKRRPYIIQASKMRPWIEEMVLKSGKIPFYVDNGAFYLFEDGFCTDLNPNCHDCPISKLCKKYKRWTAYQMWKK